MAQWLRQSTASQEIVLGPFLDSTDGNTQETALTIANTDIKLYKHGSTTGASKNSGGATHDANGRYSAVLDATDTNTRGNLEVHCHPSGALAVKREYLVVPAMVFDAVVLGTDTLQVDVTQFGGVNNGATGGLSTNIVRGGTAQAGAAGTITLDASASATDDIYNGQLIHIVSGTGAGQSRIISDYVGSTKVASVGTNWATNPASDSVFVIMPLPGVLAASTPANFSNLSIDASGRVDVAKIAGTSQTARDIGASVLLSSGTGTGQISLSSGAVTVGTNSDKTGYSLSQSFPTNFASLAITAGGAVTAGTVSDKTGYALSATGSAALTEGYATDGAAPTLNQILYMIWSMLAEKSVSTTTLTTKKLDGTTTAMTFTLNDGTNPTSITRAS